MSLKCLLLLAIFYINKSVAEENNTSKLTGLSMMTLLERKSRANLVSFEPLGEHIQLGLDFLLPFLKVPIVRKIDSNGNEPALVNINTAALLSTGLLASSSALVSLIFRKFIVLGSEESSSDKHRRSENAFENELWSIFNNFKLVYTNSTGARAGTSLTGLFETINDSFEKKGIDLMSCIQKAICTRIQISARRVNQGTSSATDQIIDGLIGIKWLKQFLYHTSLKAAIEARNNLFLTNQQENTTYCDIKYSQCKWPVPEDNLMDIMQTYLKFT